MPTPKGSLTISSDATAKVEHESLLQSPPPAPKSGAPLSVNVAAADVEMQPLIPTAPAPATPHTDQLEGVSGSGFAAGKSSIVAPGCVMTQRETEAPKNDSMLARFMRFFPCCKPETEDGQKNKHEVKPLLTLSPTNM